MAHSVSGCTRGVQVKLSDPLRTRAIGLPERLRGVITTRRYGLQIHVYLYLIPLLYIHGSATPCTIPLFLGMLQYAG